MPLSAFSDPSADHIANIDAEVLPLFIGRRNFHNYTKGVRPFCPSAWGVVLDFSFADPITLVDCQFIMWTISCHSFMLNQIRKMLGAVLCWSHGPLMADQLRTTFSHERWVLGRIPGDGLFLANSYMGHPE
jgi:tRNA pseudouridine(38-40) synthase